MPTVKEIIQVLQYTYDQEEILCIQWWDKTLFETEQSEINLDDWIEVDNKFDEITEVEQSRIYDKIVNFIEQNRG